ncbi:MAG: type II toxin-antitoxin system prevent-host-death family antitoxin [Acidobacteriota bacterium]
MSHYESRTCNNLKRRATELLEEVEREKQPILIAKQGLPSIYLVDTETYEFERRRARILVGIARGERAVGGGDVVTHDEFRERMSKWLK